MADYLIKDETLSTIANGVRNVSGVNKELTPSSMAEIMSSLSVTGVDTFDATAVSNEIFANKTAYVDGEKVTGTFSIDNELNTLDTLINDISKALEGKASGGSGGGSVETCLINISSDYAGYCIIFYQQDATHWDITEPPTHNSTSLTVVCNSIICISQSGYYKANISDGEILHEHSGSGFVYRVPNTPNASISINIETD